MAENKSSQIDIVSINREIAEKLSNKEIVDALVATTFPKLSKQNIQLALFTGMLQGWSFEDFLKKKVYAIPFNDTFSLVGSIDSARAKGMEGGIVGKKEPVYDEKDGKIISCTVTVLKKTGDYIGEFSEKVYFDEYYKGVNTGSRYPTLWDTKPRTMIKKVAEMASLRSACPDELSKFYVEEEMEQGKVRDVKSEIVIDITAEKAKLEKATNLEELKTIFLSLPIQVQTNEAIIAYKNELKAKFIDLK